MPSPSLRPVLTNILVTSTVTFSKTSAPTNPKYTMKKSHCFFNLNLTPPSKTKINYPDSHVLSSQKPNPTDHHVLNQRDTNRLYLLISALNAGRGRAAQLVSILSLQQLLYLPFRSRTIASFK